MLGKRLPVVDGQPTWPQNAGEYSGPCIGQVADPNLPTVFFLKPNARDADAPRIARVVHHCCSPPHTFKEEPDGSLTIYPSLSDRHGELPDSQSDGWHGYLEKGVWRKV
jgi:hypothetical protein